MSKNFRTAVETIVTAALEGVPLYGSSYHVKQARILVEDGITEHAEKVADTLRRIGQEQGLSESEVENALIEAGLADAPEPEVEPEPLTTEERLDKIEGLLASLLEAAKNNGITITGTN